MNEEIITLENSIISVLNSSDLPLEVKRLILKDMLNQIDAARIKLLEQELLKKGGGKGE